MINHKNSNDPSFVMKIRNFFNEDIVWADDQIYNADLKFIFNLLFVEKLLINNFLYRVKHLLKKKYFNSLNFIKL